MYTALLLVCAAGSCHPFGEEVPVNYDPFAVVKESNCHCPHNCGCPGSQGNGPCECLGQRHDAPCSLTCCCGCNEGGYCKCGGTAKAESVAVPHTVSEPVEKGRFRLFQRQAPAYYYGPQYRPAPTYYAPAYVPPTGYRAPTQRRQIMPQPARGSSC